jgi:uncharacterized protein (DUF302 family)
MPIERAATREARLERFSVVSSKPFAKVQAEIEAAVGHPDLARLVSEIAAAQTEADLERAVNSQVGPSGLMEFNRFDLGEVLRKQPGTTAKVVRLLVGNPLIMKQMVELVPDAGSYAPVTVLIDERPDGVHVSYDTMASLLAPYGNKQAVEVARGLDRKVEALVRRAAF